MLDHLFRRESGKLVSVLTHIFGSHNLQLAEDVVQDTLLEALHAWRYKGIPQNPNGWLYTVAKNKALNIVNRDNRIKQFVTREAGLLESAWTAQPALEHFFSDQEIADDQLRMMFTCCHTAISTDSQVALMLRTLCGFSIPEISRAFLTTEENIHKRLVRARQKIREANIAFEMPTPGDFEKRTGTVLEAIYLLFNEGYSASAGNDIIRYELCEEAIRLAEMVATHTAVKDKTNVYALLALMLLNASRFYARQDEQGNIIPMAGQDRSKWDNTLVQRGLFYFEKNKDITSLSVYHILAAISAHHCAAQSFAATDWQSILFLYDGLLQIDASPVVLLNRSIALAKVKGPSVALQQLQALESDQFLQSYYLFHATCAELYMEMGQLTVAARYFQKAISLTLIEAEKALLQKKLTNCLL